MLLFVVVCWCGSPSVVVGGCSLCVVRCSSLVVVVVDCLLYVVVVRWLLAVGTCLLFVGLLYCLLSDVPRCLICVACCRCSCVLRVAWCCWLLAVCC